MRVLGDRVLIEADKAKDKTDSGLLLVEDWKSIPPIGTVTGIGPLVTEVKVGDRVVFERYAARILEGEQRMCLQKHIMAVISE